MVVKEQVQAEPLDVHMDKKIDLIKIDIEGGEYDAFLGIKNLLEHKKVCKIVFELNKLRSEETWMDFYVSCSGFIHIPGCLYPCM